MAAKWKKLQQFVSVFKQVDTYLVGGKQLKYGVGVDGSAISKKLFKTVCQTVKEGDRIYCLYIEDPKAKGPFTSQSHVEKEFQLLASQEGKEVTFYFEPKQTDMSICETLMALVDRLQLDFISLGAYGTSAEGEVEMKDFLKKGGEFGKVSDESLRTTSASLILVKTTTYEIDPAKKIWVLATDNSPAAQAAFALCLRKMVKPGDELHVLYASEIVSHTTILEMYDVEMRLAGVDGKVVFLNSDPGGSVVQTIAEYTKNAGADFLVIGCSGYGNKKLGSVSMGCLRTCRCAVIIIKDPREVEIERNRKAGLAS